MGATTQIRSLAELTAIVASTTKEWRRENIWWRGHASASWPLVPGVFRGSRDPLYEQVVVRLFLQRARSRHANCPGDKRSDWLFLMQHYGLPTRLLDWSESPLVALFFAVQKDVDTPGCLVALEPFKLNEIELGIHAVVPPSHPTATVLISSAWGDIAQAPTGKAAALIADESDPRMLSQLTAFTVHAGPEPLDRLPGNEQYLRRFEIPAASKAQLRHELRIHGVRLSNLFPDLHHLAEELRAS